MEKLRASFDEEKRKTKAKKKKILICFFTSIFIICMVIIAYKFYEYYRSNKVNNEVREIIGNNNEEGNVQIEKSRIEKLNELKKINNEIFALIEIKDTNINYPVLYCGNNDYYMKHNYKKENSNDGALFLDKDYDFNKPSSNLLIYGHNNIGSKEMFVELLKYKDEAFYNTHKTFNFTTSDEEAEYEIISVFLSKVYNQSDKNVFRYYYFIDAKNEKEYNEYVNNCKKASLYKIDTTANYGDQLITLSTCDYSQKDGRFVVVAKKVNKINN